MAVDRKHPPIILMINDHICFGGGGDATFRAERRIYEQAGYSVYTFSYAAGAPANASGKDFVCRESNSRLIQKLGKYVFSVRAYRTLRRVLIDLKPSFVHLHLPVKYPVSTFAALRGHPVAHTMHGPALFCATGWGCRKKDSSACELGTGLKCFLRGCIPLWQVPCAWVLAKASVYFARRSVKLFRGPSRQICEVARKAGLDNVEYIPLCIDPVFARTSKGNRSSQGDTASSQGTMM